MTRMCSNIIMAMGAFCLLGEIGIASTDNLGIGDLLDVRETTTTEPARLATENRGRDMRDMPWRWTPSRKRVLGWNRRDNVTRRRRSKGLDIYSGLAAASGGSVYHTDKGGIGKIADIIKESATTSAASILKMTLLTTAVNKDIEIPVDDTITQLTIKIIAEKTTKPTNSLTDPDKKTLSMSSSTANVVVNDLGAGLRLIKVKSPKPGVWVLKKTDRFLWNVEVTGQSTVDFSTRFVQADPVTGFQYEITGRPIAGDNATVIITVPAIDKIGGITRVVLTDNKGLRLGSASLIQKRGRAVSIFTGTFVLPNKAFQVTIQGSDKSGNKLQRLQPSVITTIAVKLTMATMTANLYINEELTIAFTVTNTGGGTSTINVDIKDDQGFAVTPTHKAFTLPGGHNSNGTFTLHAGSKEGITDTVTISAQPSGLTGHSPQFVTRRITVEKRVIRMIDNTVPECNVTSLAGNCNATQLDPCACGNYKWSGSGQFRDTDSGLYQVSSTLDANGYFSHDNISTEHDHGTKSATLRSDCCQPVVYVYVVDQQGNTGQCKFDLAPGLTHPTYPCTTIPSPAPTTRMYNTTEGAQEGGLSPGAIAGIVVGVLVLSTATVVTAVLAGGKLLCFAPAATAPIVGQPPPSSTLP